VIRTHDVAETRDAALVGDAFARDRLRDPGAGVEELDVTTAGEARRYLTGDRADRDAARAVSRLVAVDVPSAAARDRLLGAVDGTGLVAAPVGGRVVLGGPLADLRGLADRVSDSDRLVRALDRLRDLR
jgi:dihydropteroate synthase